MRGDPKDEATTLGPMIDEAAAKRLEGWVNERRRTRGEACSAAEGERGDCSKRRSSRTSPRTSR